MEFIPIGTDFPLKYREYIGELEKIKHFSSIKAQYQHLAARIALQNGLEKKGQQRIALADLQLVHYQELPQYPQYRISLSHTEGVAGALIGKSSKFCSLGIDIELLDREITKGATKFFINEWDNQNLSVISLWTIKEAAFKAISSLSMRMGSGDDQLTLKKIWINKGYFGLTMTDRPPLGIYQLQTIKVDQKTFIVAQAFIFKERSAVTG